MPGLSDFPALDVAIGLVLVYLVLSLIVSGISELIARALSWRAKLLTEGLRNLLNDPKGTGKANEVLSQPLVRGLQRHGAQDDPVNRKAPSYLPANVFATALLDTIAPPDKQEKSTDLVKAAADAVEDIEDEQLRGTLRSLLSDARGDLDRFRRGVEEWYEAAMERVSGWYKRRIQVVLLVLGMAAAVGVNADSFQIGNALWTDETIRAAVVSQAEESAKKAPSNDAEERIEAASQDVKTLEALKLPIGWSNAEGDPRKPPAVWSWAMLGKILGLAITGFAVSLGAPFWFDTLGRAARLRSSGPRAEPKAA